MFFIRSSRTKVCMSMLCVAVARHRVSSRLWSAGLPFHLQPSFNPELCSQAGPSPRPASKHFSSFSASACIGVGASRSSLCDLSLHFIILSHLGSGLRCGEHSFWLPGWNASTPIPSTHPHAHNFRSERSASAAPARSPPNVLKKSSSSVWKKCGFVSKPAEIRLAADPMWCL